MSISISIRALAFALSLAAAQAAAAAEHAGKTEAAPPAATSVPAATTGPFTIIRTLQALQEQIARGNAAAQAAQPRLMAHIAERFLAADPEVWKEPRNTRAAVSFLLSGGKPAVIRAILEKAAMAPDMDRLLKGALAYGEGNDEVARQLLGGVEARALPPMLGGHLALVQASLLPEADNAKAGKLLDLARLLVPGTLVEEAALRRQLFLLVAPETLDKFVFLARQYIRRYRTSIYANNFKQRLSAVARNLAVIGDVASLNKLETVLVEYPTADQTAFYLAMAKAAIVEGRAMTARYAAEKASGLAGAKGEDAARARLYAAAALVVSDDAGRGLKTLEAIDRSHLTPDDAELLDAALAVASGVRAEMASTVAPAGAAPSGADPQSVAVLDRATAALANADRMLGGPSQ